jgi:LCP family protein required for cell wall assembly
VEEQQQQQRIGAPRRWRRVALTALLVVLVLLVGSGLGAYLYVTAGLEHRPAEIAGERPQEQAARDYLLIGSDTREGASASFQEEGLDAVAGARSDTAVLLHLPPGSQKALLVSFPRDLIVDIPACRQSDGALSEPRRMRFNRAFTIGGAGCTMATVEDVTGVRLDDYVEVDFAGFSDVVDALGGVPFCTPVPLEDPAVPRQGSRPGYGTGLSLPVGTTELDGETALKLVRARYGLTGGSDLGRIQRQQQFLGAVVRRATSTELLLNPARLVRFLRAAAESVTTGNLGPRDLRAIAERVKGLEPGKVTFVTLPVEDGEDGATLRLNQPAADELFQALQADGAVPGGQRDAAPVVPVAPETVRVRVLNGTGTPGLAGRVADELSAAGFRVVDVATADSNEYASSVVRHGPDRVESSQTLSAAVPASKRQLDASLDRVVELVIGRDFTETRAVRVSTPTPTAAVGTAGPGPLTAEDDPCT